MQEELVTIAHYTYSLRAYLTKGRLENEGIPSWLFNENADYSPQRNPEGDIELKVKEGDVTRARAILHEIQEEGGPELFEDRRVDIRKILVPVDLADDSIQLCLIAGALATRFGSEVRLFHSYFVPALDIVPVSETSLYPITLDDHVRQSETQALGKLAELKKQLEAGLEKLSLPLPSISLAVASGFPDDEILEEYRSFEPNLVLMGSGKNFKGHEVYGSVTAEVIEKVKVPVLVIPPNLHFLDLRNISNVMYATNFDPSDFRAIHKLLYLMSPFQVKVHFVHIRSGKKDEWDEVKLDGLREHLKKESIGPGIEVQIIEADSVISGVEDYIQKNEIDLIALLTRKRSFLSRLFKPGMARQLLAYSQRPFLVFH